MHLLDTVALVTGAGHRLGRAIALGLANAGCNVVVHYGRSREAAGETSDMIRDLGRESLTLAADLARPEDIEALFCSIQERFGRLDVLVNSAATFERTPFDELTVEQWDRALDVNTRAPFLCTQHAACLMRDTETRRGEGLDRAPGSIVNIGDMAGVTNWVGYSAHGVSKAGLLHLTRLTARELAPEIRVNAIVPGPILPPAGEAMDEEAWAKKGTRVPLGRPGDPSRIADSVVFLSTNDYVTGDVMFVDGGEHLLPGGGRDGG
jgi:pteridine reductase